MPNLNYQAGRRIEWGRRKHWMKRGWTVTRSSGSRGIWDLVGVRLEDPEHPVMFVQCKIVPTMQQAKAMIKKFQADPPMPRSPHWTMQLDIKVKGSSEVLSIEL